MQLVTHYGPVRARKLWEELTALEPAKRLSLTEHDDGDPRVNVGFTNSTEAQIRAVLAAHDPTTPSVAEATEILEAENETTLRTRATQGIATLENAWENWATLTAAQKDAALRLNVRVTVALARITLRKLDAT